MKLEKSLLENVLQKNFALTSFREGQYEIITDVLAKKDVLAVLPTGGGKSLCYQYPAVYLEQLVIVISPLIALMKDQVASLLAKGIPAGCLHSGQSDNDKRAVFAQIEKGGTFILYLSPERAQKEGFQRWIQNRKVGLFAIDEAHCVSQWGHDFREEYSQLRILKSLRPDVPILALTASATPMVLNDVSRNLTLHKPERRVHGFYRSNLYYQVEPCVDDDMKVEMLMQGLKQNPEGRILIYCGTHKVTEELSNYLQKTMSDVGFYHAGLSADERTKTQEAYSQGRLRILVATNAFGMGIDQPDVRLVMHYQMPANIDSLYQEMGRAGRDGKPSTCLMLYAKKDKGLQSYFISSSEAPFEIKDSRWNNLEALVNYSEGSECRHSEILTYYRDSQRIPRCGHCDNCEPASERRIQRPMKKLTVNGAKPTKLRRSRVATLIDSPLNDIQEVRFQALKRWRKQKALELDAPAFVVFSDQTLKQMAIKNPQNLEELRDVHGVGDAKIDKYGPDVLAELIASEY